VEHFTVTVEMLQMFILYKNDTSNGQNITTDQRFDASNNKSCTSKCASVNDVTMNVVTDPEARYYLRPVVYSSGQQSATVENTPLRSSPHCCSLSSSRWRNELFHWEKTLIFNVRTPRVE